MNKNIAKLLIIMMLAVLFVPLFYNHALAASVHEFNMEQPTDLNNLDNEVWDEFKTIINISENYNFNYVSKVRIQYEEGSNLKEDIYYIAHEEKISEIKLMSNTYQIIFDYAKQEDEKVDFVYVSNKDNIVRGPYSDWAIITSRSKPSIAENEIIWTKGEIPLPEIISRPILEYPYYIIYCNADYSWVRMQSYKEIPVFTVGEYRDTNKNEYDIKWVGRGPMIEYNWQIPPGGGAGIEEWVKSGGVNDGEIFTDSGAERKIILETNHAINIDTEHIPPVGQGREISEQDPFFKLISHQDPIETVYDKVRIQVQLGDNLVSAKGMPKELAEIYVNGAKYQIISREWKGYKIESVGMLLSKYFYNEIITIDLYVPFTTGQYKTINITAVIPEEKQYLLNIRNRKEYNLNFQVFRYEFTDENKDGIDDNTGETGNWNYDNDVPGYSEGQNPPDPGNYDPGILGQIRYLIDTIGYWIMTPFRLLSEGLTYVLEQVNSVLGWASNFSIMIGSLFSFLPAPIVSLIGLSFVAIIVVTLIKAVRG